MQQHRHANADSRAVNSRDQHLMDLGQQANEPYGAVGIAERRPAHKIHQIISGREARTRAAEQNRSNRLVPFSPHQRIPQRAVHGERDGIALFRAVQAHLADGAHLRDEDVLGAG
jgi:hypothetical protein